MKADVLVGMPDLQGLVGERYRLEERIGRGGMAYVFRARDEVLGRAVAVKVLREKTADPAARERFRAEARTLAGLDHPGLVAVYDAGMSGDRPFLVMELVDGATLHDHRAGRALPLAESVAVGVALADVLDYVHGRGIVHRDVKPANVMLAGDGRVLLADFGIVRLLEATTRHTGTGQTVGTAGYLAPEQVRGSAVTPAADVYSLGLVLIEMLSGRRVYEGPGLDAAFARLTRSPEIPAGLPDRLGELLAAMTTGRPERRPGAGDVAAALRGILAGADGVPRVEPRRPEDAASVADPAATTLAVPDAGRGSDTRPLTRVRSAGPPPGPARPAAPDRPVRPRRSRARRDVGPGRVLLLALGAAVVMSGLVLVLMLVTGYGPGHRNPPRVPDNLPSTVATHLKDLHEAVDG